MHSKFCITHFCYFATYYNTIVQFTMEFNKEQKNMELSFKPIEDENILETRNIEIEPIVDEVWLYTTSSYFFSCFSLFNFSFWITWKTKLFKENHIRIKSLNKCAYFVVKDGNWSSKKVLNQWKYQKATFIKLNHETSERFLQRFLMKIFSNFNSIR